MNKKIAPEPSDINWLNLNSSSHKLLNHFLLFIGYYALVLAVCFVTFVIVFF